MNEEDPSNLKSRDFICACGKNYLSYAALFTHIKQKHEGKVSALADLGAGTHHPPSLGTQEGSSPEEPAQWIRAA